MISDAGAFSFRLNKGFRLLNFLQSAPCIRVIISDFIFLRKKFTPLAKRLVRSTIMEFEGLKRVRTLVTGITQLLILLTDTFALMKIYFMFFFFLETSH